MIAAVGAGDSERAGLEGDVGGRGLQQMAGERPALLDHLGRRLEERLAARHDRARAAGAAADQQLVAVALDQIDQLERQTKAVDQHLCEGRGVTLAVIERAGDHGDAPVRLEADAAHLRVRRRRDLEIAGQAAAAQQPSFFRGLAGAERTRPNRPCSRPASSTAAKSPLSYSRPEGAL